MEFSRKKIVLLLICLSISCNANAFSFGDIYQKTITSLKSFYDSIVETFGPEKDSNPPRSRYTPTIDPQSRLMACELNSEPFGTIERLTKDIYEVLDEDADRNYLRKTNKIKLCTKDLSNYINFIPLLADHVYIGFEENGNTFNTNDTGMGAPATMNSDYADGAKCTSVLMSPKDDPRNAVKRLRCVSDKYHQCASEKDLYNFWSYNCGGYSRDILAMSGLKPTRTTNFGIGTSSSDNEVVECKRRTSKSCGLPQIVYDEWLNDNWNDLPSSQLLCLNI